MSQPSPESTSEIINIIVRSEDVKVAAYRVRAAFGYPAIGDSVLVWLGENSDMRAYTVKVIDRTFSYGANPDAVIVTLNCGPLVERNPWRNSCL